MARKTETPAPAPNDTPCTTSKHVQVHFETVDQMVTQCAKGASPQWLAKRASLSSETGSHNFTMTRDFAEARKLARDGWPEGRAKMLKAQAMSANAGAMQSGAAYMLDVGGAYPVTAIAAAGDMQCMVNHAPVNERARPVVRLMVNGSVSAAYDAEEIFHYGAALASVVDGLEQNDIRCELSVCFPADSNHGSGQKLSVSVRVKEAGEHLNLDTLAFCIAHPSMFRRFILRVIEQNCDPAQGWTGNYGYPRKPEHGVDADHDVTLLAGPQQFEPRARELKSPENAYKAMLPVILDQLRDRYTEFPPLQLIDVQA